jgi:hypothetical protein
MKRVSGTATMVFWVREFDSAGVLLGSPVVGTSTSASWVRVTGQVTLNANTTFISLALGTLTTGTGTFRFDGVQVVKGVVADIPDFDGPQLAHLPFLPDSNLAQAWLGSRLLGGATVQAGDVTLTEATWVQVNTQSVTIFPSATTTKVLLTASVNLGITVTTAGVFQFFWRWKRDATVLYTSNQVRFDSAIAVTHAPQVGSYMDSVTGGGTFVYALELFKDDTGAANNAVSAKAGSQVAVVAWSN